MARTLLIIVTAAAAFMTAAAPVAASVQVGFELSRIRDFDAAGSEAWRLTPMSIWVVTSATLVDSVTLRSPGNLSGYNIPADPGGPQWFSAVYPSYDAVRAEASESGSWSLVVKGIAPNVTSTYALTPDFSAVPFSSLPDVSILSPAPDAIIDESQPTFSWSPPTQPITFFDAALDYQLPPFTHRHMGPRNPSTTSWKPSLPVPDGPYTFHVLAHRDFVDLPVSATLLSGLDLGPVTARFSYGYESVVPLTISTPEPACCSALLLVSLATLTRRRCRSS